MPPHGAATQDVRMECRAGAMSFAPALLWDVRPLERPEVGKVVKPPGVGGLNHRYVRRAA